MRKKTIYRVLLILGIPLLIVIIGILPIGNTMETRIMCDLNHDRRCDLNDQYSFRENFDECLYSENMYLKGDFNRDGCVDKKDKKLFDAVFERCQKAVAGKLWHPDAERYCYE